MSTLNISSFIAHYYIRKLNYLGIDTTSITKQAKLTHTTLTSPSMLMPITQFYQLIELIIETTGNPHLGFDVGNSYRPSDLGLLDLSSLNSHTLGQALNRLRRFQRMNMSFWQLPLDLSVDGHAIVTPRFLCPPNNQVGQFLLQDFISRIRRFSNYLSISDTPYTQINLAWPTPDSELQKLYESNAQCPVTFNAPRHELILSVETLGQKIELAEQQSNTLHDAKASYILEKFDEPSGFIKAVREAIIKLGDEGKSGRDNVAAKLLLSSRTLRRRLQDLGTSYQEIADQIIYEQAIELLNTSTLSLNQISDILGYSDQRSFLRAFKRWTGETPSSYRSFRGGLTDETSLADYIQSKK